MKLLIGFTIATLFTIGLYVTTYMIPSKETTSETDLIILLPIIIIPLISVYLMYYVLIVKR